MKRLAERRTRSAGRTNAAVGIGAAALVLAWASSAFAHHSAVMFDASKDVTFVGTVKEMLFTNPHVMLIVAVRGSNGKVTDWHFEGGSPGALTRAGFYRSTLATGDKVTVIGFPLKDGRPGAGLKDVLLDGKSLLLHNVPAASAPSAPVPGASAATPYP